MVECQINPVYLKAFPGLSNVQFLFKLDIWKWTSHKAFSRHVKICIALPPWPWLYPPLRNWGQGAEAHPMCCTSIRSPRQSTCISIMGRDNCYKKYLGLPTSVAQLGGSKLPFSLLMRNGWMIKWRKRR